MKRSNQFVVFALDEQRIALYLSDVERVVPAVEVTRLPKAPETVLGVINLQGQVIPVFNIRKRFRMPEPEMDLSDHLLIAHTSRRTVALVSDKVSGLVECSEGEVSAADKILPGLEYVEGVLMFEDGMILIHDLDKFLSLDEERALDEAMRQA